MKANLSAVDLLELARGMRLTRFLCLLSGNALAPRLVDGDVLLIDTRRQARAGDVVIASVSGTARAYVMNGDQDLVDFCGAHVESGGYVLLGLVVGTAV